MKVVATDGDGKIRIENISVPEIGEYDCLVKNKFCVFCNSTDRHIINNTFPHKLNYPGILGHESFGEIIKTGNKVRYLQTGERIFRAYAIYPNESYKGFYSSWGGFSEYGKVCDMRAANEDGAISDKQASYFKNQFKLDPEISDDDAQCMIVYREAASALWQIPEIRGKTILILGTGSVGLSMCRLAKMLGAKRITLIGRKKDKIQRGLHAGADDAFLVHEKKQMKQTYDMLIDSTGSIEMVQGFSSYVRRGAGIYKYAIYENEGELDRNISDYNVSRIDPDECKTADWVESLVKKKLLSSSLLVTHHFSLDDIQKAYKVVLGGNCIKVVIHFT